MNFVKAAELLLAHTNVSAEDLEFLPFYFGRHGSPLGGPLGEIVPALHWAVRVGSREMTALLLAVPSIDVNVRFLFTETDAIHSICIDTTPLHQAAHRGHREIFELLLAAPGVDVNAVDYDDRTALHLAALGRDGGRGYAEIVDILLSMPEVEAQVNLRDMFNETALGLSVRRGHLGVLERILSVPGVEVKSWEEISITRLLVNANFEAGSDDEGTALRIAELIGCRDRVESFE